ncbi:hypothetical protein GCM10009839_54390 [Catenulispora yoronensis]|uniref:Condensation domain-containing protein n=1 Tax=Catenulispora yoronensis TaxID=450799 RepID=A0ABN2UV43_9ACTN
MDTAAAERELLARIAGARRSEAIRPRAAGVRSVVASHGQQQLWLMDQINPGSREYVYPEAIRLTGALDPDALRAAFVRLVERHEVLRTRFVLDDDGVVVQLVDEAARVPFEYRDQADLGGESLRALADRQVRELVAEPFDLEAGPLLRLRLTRLAPDEHLLTLVVHHIVCDGWSLGVIARELPLHYEAARTGRASDPAPPAIQYADFSIWQQSEAQEHRLEPQIAFWHKYLAGFEPFDLPTDLPRPATRSGHGEALRVPLPGGLSARVSELAQELRVTPYMCYLAVYHLLLSSLSGATDIAVGTPVSGRVRAETEDLIGYFVNTVVVRTDTSGALSFADYLGRVRTACLDAFSHQDVPFARLVDEFRVAPDLSRTPLVQHAFVYSAGLASAWDLPYVRCENLRPEMHIAKCDLSISLSESEAGGSVRIEYSTDLFRQSTAETIGAQFLALAGTVLDRPHARLERGTP